MSFADYPSQNSIRSVPKAFAMHHSEIKRETTLKGPSPTLGWMVWGGVLGSIVVSVHIALDIFELLSGCHLPLHPSDLHRTTNPFAHVLAEFAIFGGGSAVVFGLFGVLRKRLKPKEIE